MNIKELAKPAVRALVAAGACLALIAPAAGARPIGEPVAPVSAPSLAPVPAPQLQRLIRGDRDSVVAAVQAPTRQTTSPQAVPGGFDWVMAGIAGVAFAGVLVLVWLAAAGITRVTRERVAQ